MLRVTTILDNKHKILHCQLKSFAFIEKEDNSIVAHAITNITIIAHLIGGVKAQNWPF